MDNSISIDKAAHRVVDFHLNSMMLSGTVIEGDYLAFYHEARLYSVKNRKTGMVFLVYADNPNDAIKRCKQIMKAVKHMDNLTPEASIIRLNSIRTDTDERDPAIDMAIRAINRCMVKRKPVPGDINGRVCPVCGSQWIEDFCANCGQALDWS